MTESIPNERATIDELRIERVFDAPCALVFANWTEAEHLGAWFAPAGFEVVDSRADARPGGRLRVAYRSPSGRLHVEHGEFLEVVAPEHLRFTLINEDERGRVLFRTEVHVSLRESAGKTAMSFRQTGFAARAQLDSVKEGWVTCFHKLDQNLSAERELRALFDDWFRASERKDLDASMAPIASDVIAYEHETPLVHRGVESLRTTCKAGFDQAPDRFGWDVPDLHLIVRGDIAVAWGLNHMHGPGLDLWSRGTRVFQKLDGRWQMIHQHVSFPRDPATGTVKMDLRP